MVVVKVQYHKCDITTDMLSDLGEAVVKPTLQLIMLTPCCQIDVTDAVEAQRSLQAARDQLAQEKVRVGLPAIGCC